MTISTIVLAITGVFGGGGEEAGGPPSKDEGWLDGLVDIIKRLVGKAVEKLSDIVVSALGAILSFLGKVVGSVTGHTWPLIAFVTGLIGVWVMQRIKKG